ncbi:MAG: tRNA pseudouridine(38-40) synthase TruA [Gemmatimonadota bacterium]
MELRENGTIRATVHYDGTGFHGSQRQPAARTVQGEVERCLGRLFEQTARVDVAGRTDAGVHASGQEIAFKSPPGWDLRELRRALNAVLPNDVWIESLTKTSADFHPRFSATGRRYEYYIGTAPDSLAPSRHNRIWQLGSPLSPDILRSAAKLALGRHSFARLSKAGPAEKSTICCVEKAEWSSLGGGDVRLTVVADRFLRRMVRYLVATMVDISLEKRPLTDISALLAGRKARPPEPAPAVGLYLTGVRYADGWNRSPGVPGLGVGRV